MGFLGIRIEMSTAIITSISVGIGVEFCNTFHDEFWQIYNENKNIIEACILTNILAGPSILFDMNSNIMGFIVFIFLRLLLLNISAGSFHLQC
jgi:predicted RND superfamily exporter protein